MGGSSEDDAAIRSGSVIAPGVDISILVLGEAAIGKSYMIQAYVGNRIPSQNGVPNVHPVYRMTHQTEPASAGLQVRAPTQNTRVLIDTDGVRLGASADDIKAAIARHKPDVVVLCYSQEDPTSIVRLAQHWLPAINESSWRAPSWPYIPVVLAGLCSDSLDSSAVSAWLAAYRQTTVTLAASYSSNTNPFVDDELLGGHADEVAAAGSVSDLRDRIVENVMIRHGNVMATINVSALRPTHQAGLLGEIGEVWDRAVDQVLHPVFPIFSTADTALTSDAGLAFLRIFRIIDADNDGVLGVDEFQMWQTLSFGYRVSDGEVRDLFQRISLEFPEGVTEDASCLTEAGFRHVLVSYIFSMATDSVWTVLHAFGYRWGVPPPPHGRLSLELGSAAQTFVTGFDVAVSGSSNSSSGSSGSPLALTSGRRSQGGVAALTSVSVGTSAKHLYLHMPDAYVTAEARTSDGSLVLSGTGVQSYQNVSADVLTRSELRRTGLGFVCRLFKRFSSGRNHATLMPEDIARIFEVTPSRTHPFGNLFPDVTSHSFDGSIGLVAWVNLWQMLLTCSPAVGLASLYQLGFSTPRIGSSGSVTGHALDFSPIRGVEQAGPRRTGGDYTPSPVRRVFVMGSAGSGKTSLIMHYLNGPGSLRDRTESLNTFSRDERPGPLATSTPAHFVAEAALPDNESAAAIDAMPIALVLTEWPGDSPLSEAMTEADAQADALVVCVDPAIPSSVAYFRNLMERVPDRVPTVVVAMNHERAPGRMVLGLGILSCLCQPDASIALCAVPAGPGPNGLPAQGVPTAAQRRAFVVAVAAAQTQLDDGMSSSAQYAVACRNMSDGGQLTEGEGEGAVETIAPGLGLEIFKFGLKAKHESTLELFKYVTAITLRHGMDNPKTAARRSKERLRLVLLTAARVGGFAVGLAALGGLGWYIADYRGSRQRTKDAITALADRLKSVVGLANSTVPSKGSVASAAPSR